jgi:hypothetical protein
LRFHDSFQEEISSPFIYKKLKNVKSINFIKNKIQTRNTKMSSAKPVTLVAFEDKNSFALKDKIKEICNGKARFDGDKKVWMVPEGALRELKRLSEAMNETQKGRSAEIWKKACKECGHKFVKKGTPEYEEVLVRFKELMKEPEEKEEEDNGDGDDFDEDDVVFD